MYHSLSPIYLTGKRIVRQFTRLNSAPSERDVLSERM